MGYMYVSLALLVQGEVYIELLLSIGVSDRYTYIVTLKVTLPTEGTWGVCTLLYTSTYTDEYVYLLTIIVTLLSYLYDYQDIQITRVTWVCLCLS